MVDRLTHVFRLHKSPFNKIKQGFKTIEMRLWDEKRRRMRVGDNIQFYILPDEDESFLCRIRDLHHFPSFTEMCKALPLENMGYEGQSLQAWYDKQDHGMSTYYTPEEEAQFGVVGIELNLVKL